MQEKLCARKLEWICPECGGRIAIEFELPLSVGLDAMLFQWRRAVLAELALGP